jgi:2-(1,2-epoxy-1,2-dihydrophenyl)acetyl-CoA isomerase
MELVLTNRSVTADEALSWGLVNQVVDDAECLDKAIELATKLAAGPKRAFGKAKRLIAGGIGALEAHMVLESETISQQAISAEGQEGIRAFLDKRKPQYS